MAPGRGKSPYSLLNVCHLSLLAIIKHGRKHHDAGPGLVLGLHEHDMRMIDKI